MKRLISLLLALLMLNGALFAAGADVFAEEQPYKIKVISESAKTAKLIRYDYAEEQLVVPDVIDGYTITELSGFCIQNNDVTRSIHIGRYLQCVDPYAFYGLIKHEAFTVDSESPYFKEENGILYDITGTQLVRCPQFYQQESFVIPDRVTEIGATAFSFYTSFYQNDGQWYSGYQPLKKLTIPESVTRIGDAAFDGSYITKLVIPDSVSEVSESAFTGMSHCQSVDLGANVPAEAAKYLNSSRLKRVSVAADNPYLTVENNVLFSKDKSVLYCYPGNFNDNTEYRVPDAVRTIECKAFIYSEFRSVDFNETEIIKEGAFDYSGGMENWVFPQSVKHVWYPVNILNENTKSITFLNPDCDFQLSWFSFINYNVVIYGFPGSTAEEYVSRFHSSHVNLTFSPLHTALSDADVHSPVHTYVPTAVAATCTEPGYTLNQCSVCGIEYKENYSDPLGHQYEAETTVQPTCTAQGYTDYCCTRCGDTKRGSYVGATGHSFTVTERVEATCTEPGYAKSRCVFCEEKTIEYFDALNHDCFAESTCNPTCTEGGYTTYRCSRCPYTYDADYTEPLGHYYIEKVAKAATDKAEGTVVTACERCGMTKATATISKLGTVKTEASLLTYTGKSLMPPAVTVTDVNGKAIDSENYTVSFIDRATAKNVNEIRSVGQYKMKITFKNRYSGTRYLYFAVIPKTVAVSSVAAAENAAVVNWQPDSTVSGYEVTVAADKSFDNAVSRNITGATAKTVTVNGLTAGKTYYVRIRSYKNITVDEKDAKLYSAYSSEKTVVPAAPNGWLKESGKWYYYTNNAKAKGWKKIGGVWYFFDKTTGAMQTGWLKDGGKWYYFNSSGAMVTGWQKISNKWYYFNAGGDMKTGWLKDGGKWYYLDTSGAMLANTSRTISGKTYKFNGSGVCTNP